MSRVNFKLFSVCTAICTMLTLCNIGSAADETDVKIETVIKTIAVKTAADSNVKIEPLIEKVAELKIATEDATEDATAPKEPAKLNKAGVFRISDLTLVGHKNKSRKSSCCDCKGSNCCSLPGQPCQSKCGCGGDSCAPTCGEGDSCGLGTPKKCRTKRVRRSTCQAKRVRRPKGRKQCSSRNCQDCQNGCNNGPQVCFDGGCRRPHCSHRKNGICAGCKRELRRSRRGRRGRLFSGGSYAQQCCAFRARNAAYGTNMKFYLANEIDKVSNWMTCKFGYFTPTGGDGRGLPIMGHYNAVYAVNPGYSNPRDGGGLYAAPGYGVPISVPLPPNVQHQYNYSWGTPSSRLTPISHSGSY